MEALLFWIDMMVMVFGISITFQLHKIWISLELRK